MTTLTSLSSDARRVGDQVNDQKYIDTKSTAYNVKRTDGTIS